MIGKGKGLPQVGEELKQRLIRQVLERRLAQAQKPGPAAVPAMPRFADHPAWRQIQIMREGGAKLGLTDPYFRAHEGIAGACTVIDGRTLVNFSSYNYLGLSGDPRVSAAAKEAIDRYGTSVSASRLVSGERPVHRALERALAAAYGVEDCVAFVSGHATNVTTISTLFGPKDLVVHDALAHNSILRGIQLSGAQRRSFPHNDWEALDALLARERAMFDRTLIILEGLYSMDGDFPDLPRFLEVKRRHRAFLMVDEAHSLGVLGERGFGIREHFGLDGADVDLWMGTLSKSLAACGGFVAGERAAIEILKFSASAFVYSVGLAPPIAAAALAALGILRAEPERVARLQARSRQFLEAARAAGVDTGTSAGYGVVPAITGSSIRAARLAQALFERGVNVQPILYPAVQENGARLRFFLSSEHSEAQIRDAVEALAQASRAL